MPDGRKPVGRIGVKIIKSQDESAVPTVFYHKEKQIEKSDKSEQLNCRLDFPSCQYVWAERTG